MNKKKKKYKPFKPTKQALRNYENFLAAFAVVKENNTKSNEKEVNKNE